MLTKCNFRTFKNTSLKVVRELFHDSPFFSGDHGTSPRVELESYLHQSGEIWTRSLTLHELVKGL